MFATGFLIDTDIIDIQCLDILQQMMALHLCHHTKGVPQHLPVVIHEHGLTVVTEECFQFLLIILRRIGLKQVRAYPMMHHIHLMQQIDDASDIVFICFSDHISLSFQITWVKGR